MSIYRVDLHLHTAASPDGRSSLEGIAKAAKTAGLDAIAVTDHDLCTPVPAALEGVLLIPGCEVSTAAGHITGLFLERPLPLEALGHLPAPEAAVEAIREAGGLAVLAHPYQRPGAAPEQFTFPLDAVEAVNARACFKVPEANEKAAALAQKRGLPAVGGSDAILFPGVRQTSVSALREALAAGRSRAVLRRNTSHFRKGLSQWTKARRGGGLPRLGKAALYLGYCAALDVLRPVGK